MEETTASADLDDFARGAAESACGQIEARPDGAAGILQDLKGAIVREAVELAGLDADADIGDLPALEWEFARNMPDFELGGAYAKSLSGWSLACAVLLGWLIGGVVSGLLGLLNLGGDILRAAAIFGAVWLEQYLAVSDVARNRLLKACGWLALGGVAARLAAGAIRFGAAWRTAFLGASRPGLLKGAWLGLGLVFIFVFLARKKGAPDRQTLKLALQKQIRERLQNALQALLLIKSCADELGACKKNAAAGNAMGGCPQKSCALAEGVLAVLDSLESGTRQFLGEKLAAMGYAPYNGANDGVFVWDAATHGDLYDVLGFVKDGDMCLELKKPIVREGVTRKGLAQPAANSYKAPLS